MRELIRGMGVRGRGGGGGGGAAGRAGGRGAGGGGGGGGGGEQEQEREMDDDDDRWSGKKVRVYGRVIEVSLRCGCRGHAVFPSRSDGLGVMR